LHQNRSPNLTGVARMMMNRHRAVPALLYSSGELIFAPISAGREPCQVPSGRSMSAPPGCASSLASSCSTFATWRSSLRAGPGFSRRASRRKSLACRSQVEVSLELGVLADMSFHHITSWKAKAYRLRRTSPHYDGLPGQWARRPSHPLRTRRGRLRTSGIGYARRTRGCSGNCRDRF
jgi:hypothetical protein